MGKTNAREDSTGDTGREKLRAFDIEGPVGRLEALMMMPSEPPRASAVLCHAHPLHGGMMHYKLLYRVAKLLQRLGFSVLRFNFRGVGRSGGVHDGGIGEQEDLRAAIRSMKERLPEAPLLLGGFSFGSVMAARVAFADGGVTSLLLMGFPVGHVSNARFMTQRESQEALSNVPKLFVQGEHDTFGAVSALEELVTRLSSPVELEIVDEGDHFFTDKLDDLEFRIERWLSRNHQVFGPLNQPEV